MKFLDTNVFVYAYYKPKRQLSEKELQMKMLSKKIISDVSSGKVEVITTVVHVSEVANILKHGLSLEQLTVLIQGLFMLDNVKVLGVSAEEYFAAAELAEESRLK